jgi:hypothetical protein
MTVIEWKKLARETLLKHQNIKRLRRNANWQPAADAAIAFLFDGDTSGASIWSQTSTWRQVELAFRQIKSQLPPEPAESEGQPPVSA